MNILLFKMYFHLTLFQRVYPCFRQQILIKVNYKSKIKHNSWWDYDFSESDENMSFEYAKSETKRLFEQAVNRQMIADVPLAVTFLEAWIQDQ